jgi:Sulfite oxidase and related enzymes
VKQYIALAAIAFIMIIGAVISLDLLPTSTIPLDSVEVREYQGEKLSSVNDFRENSIKGPQKVDITSYRLEVTGLVTNPQNYTYDQVKSFQSYQKVVKLDCVEGWNVNILWQGVLVKDILNEVKPLPQANTVIFYAVDGYSTSFPLEYIQNNQILMAYKMNNATLPRKGNFPYN